MKPDKNKVHIKHCCLKHYYHDHKSLTEIVCGFGQETTPLTECFVSNIFLNFQRYRHSLNFI